MSGELDKLQKASEFEKERHSSLELEKQTAPVPIKERAEAPFTLGTAAALYEVAREASDASTRVSLAVSTRNSAGKSAPEDGRLAGSAFKKKVSDAVHGRRQGGGFEPAQARVFERRRASRAFSSELAATDGQAGGPSLDRPLGSDSGVKGASAVSAFAGAAGSEAAHGLAHFVKAKAKRAPRDAFFHADETGSSVVQEQVPPTATSTDRSSIEAANKAASALDPVNISTARRGADFVSNEVLPGGRARRRMTRWDAKASIARGKADTFNLKADVLSSRLEGVDQKSLQGRWLKSREARLRRKSDRKRAVAARLDGDGKGLLGSVMKVRRSKARFTAEIFNLKNLLRVLASLGGVLLVAFGLVLILMLLTGSASGGAQSTGTLTGVDAQVAATLRSLGFNNVQIAAVIGNLHAESGMDPTAEANFDGSSYPYERALGLFQFTDAGNGPNDLYAVANLTAFKNWCSRNSKSPYDAGAQVEYWATTYRAGWSTSLHRSGYYSSAVPQYAGRDCSLSAWDSTNDVDLATYMFMACSGRPAAWAARYQVRVEAAREIYAALTSGGLGSGEEYAASSEQQKAIVDAAKRTPCPGPSLCATWVSNVFRNAGVGWFGGDACDMYWAYCHSTDRSQLKVGMLVAVPKSSASGAGAIYGHVGIYVGDGMVMHSTGGAVVTESLDSWIATYGNYSTVKWGFPSVVGMG